MTTLELGGAANREQATDIWSHRAGNVPGAWGWGAPSLGS